jgi:hypothetical protein
MSRYIEADYKCVPPTCALCGIGAREAGGLESLHGMDTCARCRPGARRLLLASSTVDTERLDYLDAHPHRLDTAGAGDETWWRCTDAAGVHHVDKTVRGAIDAARMADSGPTMPAQGADGVCRYCGGTGFQGLVQCPACSKGGL